MIGNYGYYTGIIFRAYTFGTGDAVVRGGRYDHLLEKFGKDTPSIGFAILLDELMGALGRQKIPVETIHRQSHRLYRGNRGAGGCTCVQLPQKRAEHRTGKTGT